MNREICDVCLEVKKVRLRNIIPMAKWPAGAGLRVNKIEVCEECRGKLDRREEKIPPEIWKAAQKAFRDYEDGNYDTVGGMLRRE